MTASKPAHTMTLRTLRPGDLGWVISRHGALYAQEHGWDMRFEALVARIGADVVERFDAKRESAWIAERDGERLGCAFLVQARDDATGEPALGVAQLRLWTNSVLLAARPIYEQAGYTLIASEAHHSFGHALVGETWALTL